MFRPAHSVSILSFRITVIRKMETPNSIERTIILERNTMCATTVSVLYEIPLLLFFCRLQMKF